MSGGFETVPMTLPATFVVGTLRHPALRLRQPVTLAVKPYRVGVVVSTEQPWIGGYGPYLTSAVEDWQQTLTELYLTLRQEQNRLGPALETEWTQVQVLVEARP